MPEWKDLDIRMPPAHQLDRGLSFAFLIRPVAIVTGYLAAFVALSRLGLAFTTPARVSPWYPPPGLSLALLLTCGLRYAPALVLGSLLADFLVAPAPLGPGLALTLALVEALGYSLAAAVLQHGLRVDLQRQRMQDVRRFALVALTAPFVVATLAVAALAVVGNIPWPDYLSAVFTFWVGDAIGIAILTPFLLIHGVPWIKALARRVVAGEGQWHRPAEQSVLEGLAQAISIVLVLWMVFGSPVAGGIHSFYLCLPLLWIALRHGLAGATIGILAIDGGTILAVQIFGFEAGSLADLQVLMLVVSLTGLYLGAVVTARRQAEAERRWLNWAIEQAGEMVVVTDPQSIIEYVNPAFERITGYRREEAIGQSVRLLKSGQQDPAFYRDLWQTILAGEIWEGVLINRKKSGELYHEEQTIAPVQDESGDIACFVAIKRDITRRVRMEEKLRVMASFAELNPAPVIRLDSEGVIVSANPVTSEFFPAVDLIGSRWVDICPDLDAEQLHRLYEEAGTMQQELHLSEKDLLLLYKGVSDIGVVHIYGFDVTERKRAESVALESQKLADLGTLAAGVAHELNTPLQVITGTSESLLRRIEEGIGQETSPSSGRDLDRLRRRLDMINRNAWRAAEIVRSLRTYAHASAKQVEANNLNEVVRDALLLIEHQLQSWHNITVTTDLAPELPALHCDRNQITQVLINLLTNARDAMPAGGEIAIRTGRDAGAGRLCLQVADTGPGIPEDVRDRIFDPFFTTKPVGEGTGLGLSIVAGIVRAHGGEIEVDNTSGRGTTFTLYFPEGPPPIDSMAQSSMGGRFDHS